MLLFDRTHAAAKRYLTGTHRSKTPAETLRLYTPLMEHCGVTRLANITGLDFIGVPVYAAIRPLSRNLSVSQGKGLDVDSAKVSALMESLECWHAENVQRPLRYESARALRRSGNVLDTRNIPTRKGHPLDPDHPTFWVEGWEFFAEEPVWVPFDLVHLNNIPPAVPWMFHIEENGNGLASGNCLLEASVHALCELIERDATSLWFLNPGEDSEKRSQIDLGTVDAQNRALIERIEAAGLLVGVYDTTSDVGVPSYNAVIFDAPGSVRAMGYFWGFGCHLEPHIALSRAVTEAVQCRLTEITGAREDIAPADFTRNRDDRDLEEMKEALLSPPPTRSFSDRASLATDSFEGDLAAVVAGLRGAGITGGALVDLSQPELGLPVVKAIVPQLEGCFEGPAHKPRARGRQAESAR